MENEEGLKLIVSNFLNLKRNCEENYKLVSLLPKYSNKTQIIPQFKKTFELLNKLWKYQQDYRKELVNNQFYSLERREIGKLATKIAQIYYHY